MCVVMAVILERADQIEQLFSFLRLVTAAIFIIVGAAWLFRNSIAARWLLAPGAVFLALVFLHGRVAAARQRFRRRHCSRSR